MNYILRVNFFQPSQNLSKNQKSILKSKDLLWQLRYKAIEVANVTIL